MTYARNATVSAMRTRNEIEEILECYRADGFAYATQGNLPTVIFAMENRRIRFVLELPDLPGIPPHQSQPAPGAQPKSPAASPRPGLPSALAGPAAGYQGQAGSHDRRNLRHRDGVPGQHRAPRQHHRRRVDDPRIDRAYRTGEMPPMLPAAGQTHPRPSGPIALPPA